MILWFYDSSLYYIFCVVSKKYFWQPCTKALIEVNWGEWIQFIFDGCNYKLIKMICVGDICNINY